MNASINLPLRCFVWVEAEGSGLMAAAVSVLDRGLAQSLAIVDCDTHYGRGTDDILQHLPRLEGGIRHRSMSRFGKHWAGYPSKPEEAPPFGFGGMPIPGRKWLRKHNNQSALDVVPFWDYIPV